MPQYRVMKPGFYNGEMYDPQGKRKVLNVEKAFKKCPSWLQPIKEESAAQRKKREAEEAKKAKENADKAAEDKKDIDSVTFTQPPSAAQVETL